MSKKQLGINRKMLTRILGDDPDIWGEKKKDGIDISSKSTKMKRILVWPNVTFDIERLEQDSYVQTIYKMIEGLNKIRKDLWWELVLPRTTKDFILFSKFKNVDVVQVKWPQNIQTTRGHFDKFSLNTSFVKKDIDTEGKMISAHDGIEYKIRRERNTTIGKTSDNNFNIHWKYYEDEVNWNFKDIDLVFSHLPDTTWNLLNYLGNEWHHLPPVLGYCHWFDVEEVCNWQYPAFIKQCEGITLMKKCYVNTESQKKLVLKNAKKYFSKSFIEDLDKKIEPYHLPVIEEHIIKKLEKPFIDSTGKQIIVFNHRTKAYKDFKNFILKVCEPLWEKRQDFKVWIPLLDLSTMKEIGNKTWEERREKNNGYIDDLNYAKLSEYKNAKPELLTKLYHQRLSKCKVGYSPPQTYNGWSVATTDGMMRGCPFVLFDADYYNELNPTADTFSNYDHAIKLLEKYLDDDKYRDEKAQESLDYVNRHLSWDSTQKSIVRLSDDIDSVIKSAPKANVDGKAMTKVLKELKEAGSMTKRELITQRWGSGIKYTQYRRALMEHPKVSDKKQRISQYFWDEEEQARKDEDKRLEEIKKIKKNLK
jgi:hypothetical protein